MRILFLIYLLVLPTLLFSQVKTDNKDNFDMSGKHRGLNDTIKAEKKVAKIDQYRYITLEHDTTYVDTSLTIQKEYSHNYLRKDNFGLLAFSNTGQTYNTLQYGLTDFSPYPEMGFKAKHFDFLEANQIQYCSVATPFTELFFKSIINRGQLLDSFITINTTKRFNFSVGYKGLRSEGYYINQLSSTGNFKFTASYSTKKGQYYINAHYTYQDISNEENGGITTPVDFESGDPNFENRQRLEVYLTDAKSFLKGDRLFFDHAYRINTRHANNNLYITHQFNYETKLFEYTQPTVSGTSVSGNIPRFGNSYVTNNIDDQSHYKKIYNKAGLIYENVLLGKFQFFIDDFRNNSRYGSVLIFDDGTIIPSTLNQKINSFGGQYEYQKNKWNGRFLYSGSLTNQSLSNLKAKLRYDFSDKIKFSFEYQNINKLPDNNYNLYQSSYIAYNWSHNFKNEKINSLSAGASTPWVSLSFQYLILNDHLYFEDKPIPGNPFLQIIQPAQYGHTINYFEIKASREFKLGHFALDNTILYQEVAQVDAILNVPEIVTRNTLYYTNYLFKKALFLQTGIVFNYFTGYYGNDYNPVIGEFFVQNTKKIGNYPNFDFFINARIRQTRIFLKAEHFNSSFSGNNYYSAPGYPYRDFAVRFGLTWNFFK